MLSFFGDIFYFFFKKIRILNHKQKNINLKKKKIIGKKIFIYFIKNCKILTNSVDDAAYITDSKVIEGPSYQYRNSLNSSIKNNFVFKFKKLKFLKRINGNLVSLITGGAAKHNYGHWLFDVLSKFLIIKENYNFKKNDYFYVPSFRYQFQKDSLKYLKINPKQIIDSEKNKYVFSKKIICSDHPFNHKFNQINKKIILSLRSAFLKFKKKSKTNRYSKIFINRDYSNFNLSKKNLINYRNERILLNNLEVQSFLKKKGFRTITLHNKSFADQIKIFSQAKVIVCLYGAELSNLIFCSKKTSVIEIKNKTKNYDFLNLSKKLGLNHYQINLKVKFKSSVQQNGIMYCSTDKISKILEKITNN